MGNNKTILVTGAKGFVGRNLVENLKNIRDVKDPARKKICIDEIFESDVDTDKEKLKEYCLKADCIYFLAGVNRPKQDTEFMQGNCDSLKEVLDILDQEKKNASIILSSSIQATLFGRFEGSEYGKSKLAAEKMLFDYSNTHNNKIYVFRFPGLFGKWCKPNYNSVVATLCDAIANDKEYKISDKRNEIELVYIDDAINSMIDILEEKVDFCCFQGTDEIYSQNGQTEEAKYIYLPKRYKVKLGDIESLLLDFKAQSKTMYVPHLLDDSFEKKLYATYISYYEPNRISFKLNKKSDSRGSFTELFKTNANGQFSLNVCKPHMTKGIHWHNLKCEIFIVISGEGIIRERKLGCTDVIEISVNGNEPEAVYMLPGYTHSIENQSDDEDLIFLVWANEVFDEQKPDTFREKV